MITKGRTVIESSVAGAAIGAAIGLVGGGVGVVLGGIIGLIAGLATGALISRKTLTGPIADLGIQAAMKQAWADSDAGSAANRHEEGGYIVRQAGGNLGVARWLRGRGASITPPARDVHGHYNGVEVVGEFHTHPNPPVDERGVQWVQGPHAGDTGAIAAENYPGDSYIVSQDQLYRVRTDGTWDILGSRRDIIGD